MLNSPSGMRLAHLYLAGSYSAFKAPNKVCFLHEATTLSSELTQVVQIFLESRSVPHTPPTWHSPRQERDFTCLLFSMPGTELVHSTHWINFLLLAQPWCLIQGYVCSNTRKETYSMARSKSLESDRSEFKSYLPCVTCEMSLTLLSLSLFICKMAITMSILQRKGEDSTWQPR